MPKVHTVKSAAKDHPDCEVKKGETYYWWKIKTSPVSGIKRCSKTYPTPDQLTNSPFLQSVYSIIKDINSVFLVGNSEELRSLRDDWVADIQQIADECEESYNNMPDHFHDTSETAALLQERKENLEAWIADLEAIDLDDEDALEQIQEIGSTYV